MLRLEDFADGRQSLFGDDLVEFRALRAPFLSVEFAKLGKGLGVLFGNLLRSLRNLLGLLFFHLQFFLNRFVAKQSSDSALTTTHLASALAGLTLGITWCRQHGNQAQGEYETGYLFMETTPREGTRGDSLDGSSAFRNHG